MQPTDARADSDAIAPRSSHQPRMIAYAVSIGLAAVVLLSLIAATNQYLLAVSIGAVVGLASFVAVRLIQLRGRLSVALCVITLPILGGLAFSFLGYLQPFIQRQAFISDLRANSLEFRKHRRQRPVGEWRQDEQGNMLPSWLADRIGPDCMRGVKRVSGNLEDFQSLRLERYDSPTLESMLLERFEGQAPLSPRLVRWVSRQKTLSDLQLNVRRLLPGEVKLLGELPDGLCRIKITDIQPQSIDLSLLANMRWVALNGESLTLPQYDEIHTLLTNCPVSLSGFRLGADGVRRWAKADRSNRPMNLSLSLTDFDRETLNAMSDIPNLRVLISSDNTMLVSLGIPATIYYETVPADQSRMTYRPADYQKAERRVSISGYGDVPVDEIAKTARLLSCEHLEMHYRRTASELAPLWDVPGLRSVAAIDPSIGKFRLFQRPEQASD